MVDLVIMDIDMPVMDGLEATRRIRSLGEWRTSVPIIGFSNCNDGNGQRACADAGMTALVSKAQGLDALLDTIQRLVPTSSPDLE